MAKVVAALRRLYNTNCIFLISLSEADSETQEAVMLTKLGKHLSKHSASNVIVPAIKYNYSKPSFRCSRNRPLNVMFSTNATKRTSLKKISNFMGPVWILFAANSEYAEQQLNGLFIPINTEFLVARNNEDQNLLIEEVYNIEKDKPKVWHYFGDWETETGLHITSSRLFERRSDFQGMTFHAVSTENPPLTVLKWKGGKLHANGFVGRIWDDMQKGLNFTTVFNSTVYKNEDGEEVDDKWAAMINLVQSAKYEVGVDALTMTTDRAKAVDFTLSMINAKYNVFIRKPDQQQVEWRTFLTPFSSGIWYTTAVYLIVTAVGLDVTHHFSNIYSKSQMIEREIAAFSFKNSLFYIYGLLCQQGTDMVPHSFSSRVAFSTALIVAVVLLANYSATLISFLTVRIEKLPFKDLEGLYKDGTYKYGTQGKSAQYFYYKDSNNTFIHQLYEKTMASDPGNFPEFKIDGLKRVCDMKFGFYTNYDTAMSFKKKLNCKIVPLPHELNTVPLSIIMYKNSPYRKFFNHKLLRMREGGLLDKHYRNILDKTQDEEPDLTSVTIEDVTPILVVLAAGVGISFSFLLVEKLHAKWKDPNVIEEVVTPSVKEPRTNILSPFGKRRRRISSHRTASSSKSIYYIYKKRVKFYPRLMTKLFR